jgi:CDP-paratose 2-epimerase
MRYLITGGCGFVGSNLASDLLRKGEEIHVLDNFSRVGTEQNLQWLQSLGDFQLHRADVRVAERLDEVVRQVRPDVIFHLAGQVAMSTSLSNPRLDFETNALGTFNLLEAVRNHAPAAIVLYSSTNKVYGDLSFLDYEETPTRYVCPRYPDGFAETLPLEFHSPYGCSKGAADQYLLDYHRIFGLRTVVFRHSSMFGGRQFATYDQGWIGWFCGQALAAGRSLQTIPFTISGSGKQVRDVLFVDDVLNLYHAAVDGIQQAEGQAFNIGGGARNSLSLLELFAQLERLLGVVLRYDHLPWRPGDQKIFIADSRKAHERLGWEPTISAEDGIGRMLSWLQGR